MACVTCCSPCSQTVHRHGQNAGTRTSSCKQTNTLPAAAVKLTTSCRREEDKRKRAEEAARYQEAAWVSADPPEDDEFWEDDVMGADGARLDPLYCVACDRTFKSQGALDSHERCLLLALAGPTVVRV